MPRDKTPVTFSRTGFDRPAINPALDFMVGEPPVRDEPIPNDVPQEPVRPSADRPSVPTAADTTTTKAGELATATDTAKHENARIEPAARVVPKTPEASTRAREAAPLENQRARRPKVRVNIDVEDDVWDRFKDAVFALRIGLGDGVNEALARHLDELERTNGGPFPKRPAERLRPGRRLQ